MTLLQRDRENLEQGREQGRVEGTLLAAKIIKLYMRGAGAAEIAIPMDLPLDYVQGIITNFESDL